MKGVEHFRMAENLLDGEWDEGFEEEEHNALARAQVHATLALVYFTEKLVLATRK